MEEFEFGKEHQIRQQKNILRGKPARSGFRWSEKEYSALAKCYSEHKNIDILISRFQRSHVAIVFALHKKALITDAEEKRLSVEVKNKSNSAIISDSDEEKTALHNKDSEIDRVLSTWITLEVLEPRSLPNYKNFPFQAPLDKHIISKRLSIPCNYSKTPWLDEQFQRRQGETAIYWMVFLGVLDTKLTLERIYEVFPDTNKDEKIKSGSTAAMIIVLDETGRPVDDDLALSSFAWGYGQVQTGKYNHLGDFVHCEMQIKETLREQLIKKDEDDKFQPIDPDMLEKVHSWLCQKLYLDSNVQKEFSLNIRVSTKAKTPKKPDIDLLNSFYLPDLVLTQQQFLSGVISSNLHRYFSVSTKERVDINQNQTMLKESLSPKRTPRVRWPSKHSLVAMQQAAVNHYSMELNSGGIMGINGPPGTGKTTLIRDVVTDFILKKALAMAKFDDPEDAFFSTGDKLYGEYLYQLDSSLLGHEIIIASSNNNAVENISVEIPGLNALPPHISDEVDFFTTLSNRLSKNNSDVDNGETWGLSAAVLGNKENRSKFCSGFWFDYDYGLKNYLQYINGKLSINDNDSDIPSIILNEDPPKTHDEAIQRWHTARNKFQKAYTKSDSLIKMIEQGIVSYSEIPPTKIELIEIRESIAQTQDEIARLLNSIEKNLQEIENIKDKKCFYEKTRDTQLVLRPVFWHKWFNTQTYQRWRNELQKIDTKMRKLHYRNEFLCTEKLNDLSKRETAQKELKQLNSTLVAKTQNLARLEREVLAAQELCGNNWIDDSFWNADDSTIQKSTIWLSEEVQKARDELFVALWKLNKAFIDASSSRLIGNLGAMVEALNGGSIDKTSHKIIDSLWSSLCLVVPIVSTTFASVYRMFENVEKNTLGLLIIDEAGQASPQAAVGIINRCQRVVVLGDPLQIPPVVTNPDKLIESICQKFQVESIDWAAPNVSVQYFADRASWLGSTFNTNTGEVWVGMPLRVHRRCENPMFQISNRISYNGLMTHCVEEKESQIGSILGESVWIDVEGAGEGGKWVPKEGEILLSSLRTLFSKLNEFPDVYIISPFKVIAGEMKFAIQRMLSQSGIFTDEKILEKWLDERVGTVHTFQGKEAEAVFFVLGASGKNFIGARYWAGKNPNLVNVALTRAKQRVYIIGSRSAWSNIGCFTTVSKQLPFKQPKKLRNLNYDKPAVDHI